MTQQQSAKFQPLTREQRLEFYLGNGLQDIDKTLSEYDVSAFSDLITSASKLTNELPNYNVALKNLLQEVQISAETSFMYIKGDVEKKVHPFTFCKNRCINSPDGVILQCLNKPRHWNEYYKPSFKDVVPFGKKKNMVFWRGTTTGCQNRPANRFVLVKKWFDTKNKHQINVGFSRIGRKKQIEFKSFVKGNCEIKRFLDHKYILSVEGNDKDTGLNWKLNSSSLVMMAQPRITSWLMETTLIPNYHYVLLNDDFSNLKQKLKWCENHPKECRQIIKNANQYMAQFHDEKAERELEKEVVREYFARIGGKIKMNKNEQSSTVRDNNLLSLT